MYLDNEMFSPFLDPLDLFNQMGPGYAQFFKFYCFILVMCAFPLMITAGLNAARNWGGTNCKTIEELKKIEQSLEEYNLPKNHKRFGEIAPDRSFSAFQFSDHRSAVIGASGSSGSQFAQINGRKGYRKASKHHKFF